MDESIETRKRCILSKWLLVLSWAAMVIFACYACTHMIHGGDTWIAMACGRHLINQGVSTVEPFSTNSRKAGPTREDIESWPKSARWIAKQFDTETVKYWHPTGWINQNWLTHKLFYWLTHKSMLADAEDLSFNSLVYLKFAIYIVTVICVFFAGVNLGASRVLSAACACFAMFVSRSFLSIRPADMSNMLTAVFLLVLVLATYRNVLYIWLIVPLIIFWCNVHGGYIYAFIMLLPFVILNFITRFFPGRFVSIGLKGVVHSIAAGIAALVIMIVISPFHLANLTHIFAITLSKDAELWHTINEWKGAFEWDTLMGDEMPFLVMFIIALVVLVLWLVTLFIGPLIVKTHSRQNSSQWTWPSSKEGRLKALTGQQSDDEFQWPRIDIALVVIAALTVYMSIRFRRFIPIAAITTCPLIAMLISQMIRVRNLCKQERTIVQAVTYNLQIFFVLVVTAAVLTFTVWFGLKFKRVYLDPWPKDPKFTSVFMRMTFSGFKPFRACKFIRDNELKGEMFNYWTEGGFIAWGQVPDPNTGRIPLQLFIDGRAQAAYKAKVFADLRDILWAESIVQNAEAKGDKLSATDYAKIGQWIDKQLRERNIWVALIPLTNFDEPFVKTLGSDPNWVLVFFDNKQKLFVDKRTGRGKELIEGIFNGGTIYPDDFSMNLIKAHHRFLYGRTEAERQQGLDFAIRAFDLNPSEAALHLIMPALRFGELRGRINNFCRSYLDDFVKNKGLYAKKDGYFHRIASAYSISLYLQKIAERQKDVKLVEYYDAQMKQYDDERIKMFKNSNW